MIRHMHAREHPAQLRWLKGEPLKEPANNFVAEKLHEYGLYYEIGRAHV